MSTIHAGDCEVTKWEAGTVRLEADELAEEAPLAIRVRRKAVTITMRTPGHDDELAAGFLLSEGVIHDSSDLAKIQHCQFDDTQSTLNVFLAPHVRFDSARLTRHVFASSSCGLCGKATIDAIHGQFPPVESGVHFEAETISQFPYAMRAMQSTFERTGGLHAAAVFDANGRLVVLREDIGRHNAVDKVIGHCLLHGPYPLTQFAIVVSGRSSFEIMQKALSARLPIVAAVSAPSDLAVEFAQQSGQTLIGFLRGRRMNIYTHTERVLVQTSR